MSVLPKTFDCSNHHLQSTHCLSPWVAEAKRKKNVLVQFQLISASRNTHKSHISLICKIPVHALQYGYLDSLTASIPSGESLGALSLPKPHLTSAQSSPMLNSHTLPSEPGEKLQEATAPPSHFCSAFQLPPLLPLRWDAMGCHGIHAMGCLGMPCTTRYRAGCMLLESTAGRGHHSSINSLWRILLTQLGTGLGCLEEQRKVQVD